MCPEQKQAPVHDDRTMALPPEDGSVDASDLATVAEGVTVAADAVSAGASPAIWSGRS